MTILPQVLQNHGNYSTAIVGKWHLGHSQWKMTPTQRGFDEFSGMLAFVPDHFTKEVHQIPWAEPAFIDWMHQKKGEGTTFFAEPEHSTLAVARDAAAIMKRHAQGPSRDHPLFLYVAFPAAHAPLTPIPGHEVHCTHIPQSWRRQYCGLVYGIDEAVGNITRTALAELGDNVLLVVASDNGGSPWFGGNNMPLRGSKITPLEGGVRAPAFVVDFSRDRHLLHHSQDTAGHGRVMTDLMHVADWLPTLAAFAGISKDKLPANIDGVDQSTALQHARPISSAENVNVTLLLQDLTFHARKEMLVEMYYPGEVAFNDTLVAYRMGEMKYIRGIIRDENFYYEPTSAWMSLTRPTWFARAVEILSHFLEGIFGDAAMDLYRVGITHVRLQDTFTAPQRLSAFAYLPSTVRLFNLTEDPYELHNLLQDQEAIVQGRWTELVARFEERIDYYRVHRPRLQQCNYIVLVDVFRANAVHPRPSQECAAQNPSIGAGHCRFLGPWIPDSVDDVYAYHGEDLVPRQDHDRLLQVKLWRGYLQTQLGVSVSKDTVSRGLRLLPWVGLILLYLVMKFVWKKVFKTPFAAKKSKNE